MTRYTVPPAILTVIGWFVANPETLRGAVVVALPAVAFVLGVLASRRWTPRDLRDALD